MTTSCAVNRMNNALAVLRSELREIRSHDMTMMKQLMTMNNSVHELTKRQRRSKSSKNKKTSFKDLKRAPMMKQIDEGTYPYFLFL